MKKSRIFACAVLIVPLVTGLVGLVVLADYSSRPGNPGEMSKKVAAGQSLPEQPTAARSKQVLVFYHPKCSCTVATARNLLKLIPKTRGDYRVVAFAYCPKNQPASWIESRCTTEFRDIPGLELKLDRGGKSSQHFGVEVSGHVLVYDSEGNLIFDGGLTPYRAHEGDCRATYHLVDCLNSEANQLTSWPVFGCKLTNHESSER